MLRLKAKQVNAENYAVKIKTKKEDMADYYVSINALIGRLTRKYNVTLDRVLEVIKASNKEG